MIALFYSFLRRWALLSVVLMFWLPVYAQAPTGALVLDRPDAYCLASLGECTQTLQQPITQRLGFDIRSLNQGKNDPITLIFAIPAELHGRTDLHMLVQPGHRNHCFQFDNQRSQSHCTERELSWIEVPHDARFFYTQNVQADDVRLAAPTVALGNTHDLQAQILASRDPLLGLGGWYVFLTAAALFQMISRRNRTASLCLALIGIAMFFRTIILGNYSFAGLSFFGSAIDRRIEFVAVPVIAICALTFYGTLVAQRFIVARRILLGAALFSAALILLAQKPEHVLLSLNLALGLTLPILALGILVIIAATRVLEIRERIVMWTGFSVMGVGIVTDVLSSFAGAPFFMGIGLFSYCFAFETLCQYILIFLRSEAAHKEALVAQTLAQQAHSIALQAQSEALLAKAQNEAQHAQNAALQVQAELARKENEHTQTLLQQSDKMATLGQLVASVTHEINTPIGAISSSGQTVTEALRDVMLQIPPLLQQLDSATSTLLVDLLQLSGVPRPPMSSREERALVKSITEKIEATGLEQARQKALFLVSMNAHHAIEKYLPLLLHPQAEQIQEAARNMVGAMNGAKNVNVAVERVIKIVKALKSFSHFHVGTEKIETQLAEGMETVLTIYQGQTKVGVQVVRDYENIPAIACFPDELNQVWTNLIHNALQAMNHIGTLTIGIRKEGNDAIVSVSDTGCGIPEDIRGKIFDVFFTTKPTGVGSGLGLDIVKKIIEKHHGRIEAQSEVGMGTTFLVILPYVVEPFAK